MREKEREKKVSGTVHTGQRHYSWHFLAESINVTQLFRHIDSTQPGCKVWERGEITLPIVLLIIVSRVQNI